MEPGECEEAFFNRPFIVADDSRHSISGIALLRPRRQRLRQAFVSRIHHPRIEHPRHLGSGHEPKGEVSL